MFGHQTHCCNVVVVVLVLAWATRDVKCNDRPQCTQTFYTTEFEEGPGDGYEVFKVDCSDVDSGPEGDLSYSLSDGDKGQFRVDSLTGAVLVEGQSDAERLFEGTGQLANPYTVSMIVADKGTPPFSTPVTVFVHMTSTNDNTPRVDNLPSKVTVSETEAVGAIVSTCNLIDDDVDDSNHGTAYVKITSGNEAGHFVLNQINCDLMLISPLDFETTPSYTLTFEAYDLDPDNPLSSTQDLVIEVEDVNDFRPACVGYNLLREVSESSPVATTLTTVDCWDKDSGLNGQLEYKVTKGDAKLTIDITSGDVSLVEPLDFEAGDDLLEIEVIVCDLGTPSLSSTVTVLFQVKDDDDNAPQWTQPYFNATASENTLIGSIVMVLEATDRDTPNTDLSKITYGLEVPCDPDWFLVDAQIGSVVVKAALDWETSSLITCQVHAYSSDAFANRTFTTMSIAITDVNDRAPIFDKFLFTGSVKEDALIGTSVLTVEADDPDDGINGLFVLSMPIDSPFSIDEDTGIVSLRGSIDYEVRTNYLLTVVAKDKGTPTQSSLTYINIQIDPVNEFDPTISPGISLTVSEHSEPGTALTKMTADDQDAGLDGQVEFFLLESDVPFLLESDTGDLRIGIGLDREVKDEYSLDILVRDKSNTTVRFSRSTIRVTVTDVNDNAPVCDFIPTVQVSPPDSAGDEVIQLRCRDEDIGNVISYNLIGTHGIFDVNSNDGKVLLTGTPIVGSYVLFVDVEDNGTPNLKITQPVPITVESQFKFDNLPETLKVWENTTIFSLLYTVNTSGTWDYVSTEIASGNDEKLFNLNPSSGEIRIVRLLDWESQPSHTLRIRAVSSHGQLIESDLIIDLIDINDDVPNFDDSFFHIKVVETVTVPRTLRTLTATDRDEGLSSEISYSIYNGNETGMFDFNQDGNFKLLKMLDYEKETSYSVTIQATDGGDPALSSTAVVFIEVVNADDNPLLFEFLESSGHFNLSEDIAVGTLVATVNASDKDTGDNIQYSIISGNDLSYFTIDKTNGTILTSKSLDYETAHTVSLVIGATNSMDVTETLSLDVDLLDINDNTPTFSQQFYSTEIAHATPANRVIGHVTVTDKDSTNNGLISLSIQTGNDKNHFRLSGNDLETLVDIDSDVQDFYTLIIKAEDSGVPSRSSSTIFQIIVDEKLLVPQFSSSSVDLILEEDKQPGTVFDCDATLAGAVEGEQGDLMYTIVGGNTNSFFFIDQFTCKIDLVKTLVYKTFPTFSLQILAQHRENYRLNNTFVVDIGVKQINKHKPIFTQHIYTWTILEDTVIGTAVGTIHADDEDIGDFGEIVYTIETNSKFDVNFSSGLIKTVAAFDYRVSQSYHVYITAKDKGFPVTKSSSAIVVIDLIDVNNHIPAFFKQDFEIFVSESTVSPVDIFVISAEDEDTGDGGEIRYSITSGDITIFHVDPSTGVLTLLSPLDFETKEDYILEINAQDQGIPSLNSTTTLTVNVVDYNDHNPVFLFQRIDLALPLDSSPFTSVYNVTATDIDRGVEDSTINYVIWNGNTNGLFTINIDSGEIKTGRDIEARDVSFDLVVIARDQGVPSLTGSTTVGVRVMPAASVGSTDLQFSVEESKRKGTVAGQITKDPLLDVTGYTIVSGNYKDAFMTEMSRKGYCEIYTTRPLDRETYSLYHLTVAVLHTTGVETVTVSIEVTDVNDNDPVVEPTSLSLEIVENTPTGSSVGQITATDDDTGSNADIEYTISDSTPLGQKHFSIDSNGVLTTRDEIDFEIFTSLTFIIVVKDQGLQQRSTSVHVSVTVSDVVETEVPATTYDSVSTFKSLEIPHSLKRGGLVFVAEPEDFNLTLGVSDQARYTSIGTNVFSVDSGSGHVAIRMEGLLYPSSSYLQWIVCTASIGAGSASKLAMIRIDTFNVNTQMVAVVVSLSANDLELQRTTLLARLQTYFPPPNIVRIWAIESTSGSDSRRRLLATESVALVVVIADDTADDVGNVDQAKTFLTQQQILTALQADSSGTPTVGLSDASIPVTWVLPYVNSDTNDSHAHPANVAFYVIIALAAIVALVLIAALTIYFVILYKKTKGSLSIKGKDSAKSGDDQDDCMRQGSWTNLGDIAPDEEHLCPPEEEDLEDEKLNGQQEKAFMLMGSPLPNARQLPPLETSYGTHPFHSYRPPSRAIKTPMGLMSSALRPPLDTTAKASTKRELPPKPPKNRSKSSFKKSKKKLSSSTNNAPPTTTTLTIINDPYQLAEDDTLVDNTDGRKKMVMSLQEEQIEKSKQFLLDQQAIKRQHVLNMKMKRKTSEAPRIVQPNANAATHRPNIKIKNAWRSPKTSTVDNPDNANKQFMEVDKDTGGKKNLKSPYEEKFPRPYMSKLLQQQLEGIRNGEEGGGEEGEDDKIDRRKSVAGYLGGNSNK